MKNSICLRHIYEDNGNSLKHHGIIGMHWGVRNGPPYPITSKAYANAIYNNAKRHVKRIQSDVSSAIRFSGGRPHGLEHKLKTKQSIKRKIETDSAEKNITESQAAKDIKDAVRFTAIYSDKDFVNGYKSFKQSLLEKGYSESRCKNYFDLFRQGKVKHKSVQSVFSAPDGYKFEVQFHTRASQDAKDKKVPLYEEARAKGVTKTRLRQLEMEMERLGKSVKDPPDVFTIASH